MKVRKTSTQSDENLILSGCVHNKRNLGELASLGDLSFVTTHANLVYSWCADHYDKYGEAPGVDGVTAAFEEWSAVRLEHNEYDKTVDAVEAFLAQLKDKAPNDQLVADRVSTYFSRNSLKDLSSKVTDSISVGDIGTAIELVSSWNPIEIGSDASVDVFGNEAAIIDSFNANTEQLINFDGELGRFFGRDLSRDSFVSFLAPEKGGKTWLMMQVAYQAVHNGLNVAFIGLGDMSQPQYMKRFLQMTTRRPLEAKSVKIPMLIKPHPVMENSPDVKGVTKVLEAMTPNDALLAAQRMRDEGYSDRLRLAAYPNSTMGVSGIEALLDRWERSGWRPDVVILDYADLLLPPRGYQDDRDGINMNWKMLRALSQQRHCCLVTATQAAARGYDEWLLNKSCFSEDKRKLAHVTSMIGINRTESEDRLDVCRLNHIVRRGNNGNAGDYCWVAGCRDIGHVALQSYYTAR